MKQENLIVSNQNQDPSSDSYFLINEFWMSTWENYIQQKEKVFSLQTIDDNTQFSIIPYPGEISNQTLQRFSENKDGINCPDYRIVNSKVWNTFFQTYGGGPKFQRKEKRINSEVINEDKIEEAFLKKVERIKMTKKNSVVRIAKIR